MKKSKPAFCMFFIMFFIWHTKLKAQSADYFISDYKNKLSSKENSFQISDLVAVKFIQKENKLIILTKTNLSEILTLRLYDNKYNLLHFQLLGYKKLGLFKTILDVNNLESGRYQVIIQFNKNSISNIFDIESHLYGFRN